MKQVLLAFLLWLISMPVMAQTNILIIGDSISSGYGIDANKGWPELLQKRLDDSNYDYRVINASIPGDLSSNGITRLAVGIRQYAPQVAIIELGENDGLRSLPIIAIRSNLAGIITTAQGLGTKILILGMTLPKSYDEGYRKQFEQVFTDLAKRSDVPVVPNIFKGIDYKEKLMQDDGINPNEKAQPIILDNIWPKLKEMLNPPATENQ